MFWSTVSSDSSVLLPDHHQDQGQSNRNTYSVNFWHIIHYSCIRACPNEYPPHCHATPLHPYYQYSMMNKESNIVCNALSCARTTCWFFFPSSSTSVCPEPGSHTGHGKVLLCPCEPWGSPCVRWFLAVYTGTRLPHLPFSSPPQYLIYDSEGGFVSLFSLQIFFQPMPVHWHRCFSRDTQRQDRFIFHINCDCCQKANMFYAGTTSRFDSWIQNKSMQPGPWACIWIFNFFSLI